MPVAEAVLPESVLHYVLRTREQRHSRRRRGPAPRLPRTRTSVSSQARSILCLPLINQGKLIGVLYLENNLAHGVFAPAGSQC